jgi:hypothetical protein
MNLGQGKLRRNLKIYTEEHYLQRRATAEKRRKVTISDPKSMRNGSKDTSDQKIIDAYQRWTLVEYHITTKVKREDALALFRTIRIFVPSRHRQL